ncbi:hypothetical protein G3480_12810 [Thiorhodococcus mannitoliphagus]|uniref:VCBS repeat-containing protein n=1 Tax=Thiorhodococcus mannitoliphagus TaxID=329406 RepID=A0A6P1DZN6_9GAMM|nr:hypothetical protein [Thiorhodococcus mannitoliphagus]NEX21184.1 hypothetical protein [Thiorhodococcus mannitoliphagus]
MEQDLDYQILRKNFAIESGSVIAEGRGSDGAPAEGVATEGQSITPGARQGFDLAVEATSQVQLELSWHQSSSAGIELSARTQDAGFWTQRLSMEQETVALDFSIGQPGAVQLGDPLALDLGGRGLQTTGLDAAVAFDLDGDGKLDQMSTVAGDTWFLALDWSQNGRIDDGTELFGDQNGAANGFDALAKYDSNGDERIDANDAVFDQLRLLQIRGDGTQVTQTLEQGNVTSIELGYQNTRKALNVYDQVAQTSSFTLKDGSRGEAADLLLGHRRGG